MSAKVEKWTSKMQQIHYIKKWHKINPCENFPLIKSRVEVGKGANIIRFLLLY